MALGKDGELHQETVAKQVCFDNPEIAELKMRHFYMNLDDEAKKKYGNRKRIMNANFPSRRRGGWAHRL